MISRKVGAGGDANDGRMEDKCDVAGDEWWWLHRKRDIIWEIRLRQSCFRASIFALHAVGHMTLLMMDGDDGWW